MNYDIFKLGMYSTRNIGLRSKTPQSMRLKTPNKEKVSGIYTRQSKLRKISESKVFTIKRHQDQNNPSLIMKKTFEDFRGEENNHKKNTDLFER